jgi:hypothetical protein
MTPEEAWRALEEDLADYLERKGVVPSCRAGCFACCFGLVTLSRLEGLALLPHLTPLQKARLLEEGPRRLALLKEGKDDPHFPSRFFQSRTPSPLLEEGLCGVYPQRPLACRGLLTEGDPRLCAPEATPPKGHFLLVPWRMAHCAWRPSGRRKGGASATPSSGNWQASSTCSSGAFPRTRRGWRPFFGSLGCLGEGGGTRCSKYPTTAKAAVGASEKPFHSSDLGTPCCETKVRALRPLGWGPFSR